MDDASFTVAAPDLIGVGVEATVARAQSLGLTWTLRPGSVSQASNNTNNYVTVTYDGDTEPVNSINITGSDLTLDDRVMAMFVPPSGLFVIGLLDSTATGRGVVGFVSSSANTAAIGGETVIMTTALMRLHAGRAYRTHYRGAVSTSLTTQAIMRVHMGTTTAGQTLDQGFYFPTLGTLWHTEGSVIVVADRNQSNTMVLTMQASAGTVTGIADPTAPRQFDISDVGPALSYPGAVTIT